jgi:hypothetical protein
MKKKIYIFCGGTINKVAPHFALCAPAYGSVGVDMYRHLVDQDEYEVILMPTAMAFSSFMSYEGIGLQLKYAEVCKKAGVNWIESNDDLRKVVDYLKKEESTRCIVMASAVTDFVADSVDFVDPDPYINKILWSEISADGYFKKRFDSSLHVSLHLASDEKIIDSIRSERKDIFLVSFKATADIPFSETYQKGLAQLKRTSSNLVFANDIIRKENMVITPEEYPYKYDDRGEAIEGLCEMILNRLNLTFNRTTLIDGVKADPLKLDEEDLIPENFIPVLGGLIKYGAFKEFKGRTAGHFGCVVKDKPYQRISSVRKVNHNNVLSEGMSKIFIASDGDIAVMGGKASVGEHTQQMIYNELGDKVHSIIHFHCPPSEDFSDSIPVKKQAAFECGSNECGINTVSGMKEIFDGVWVVHLENHGPNIAFYKYVDPEDVINFIKTNWDLSKKIAYQVPEMNETIS